MGKNTLGNRLLHSKFAALLAFTVVMCIAMIFINSKFLSAGNIKQLLVTMVAPGLMLAAVAPLLIAGEIDLAASAEAALGSMIFAQVMALSHNSISWVVALIIALVAGVVFGLINVFLVNKMKFMSFIATIGVSSVYSGIANMWTRTNNVQINQKSFLDIGKLTFIDWLPFLFVFMVLVLCVYGYILSNTPFGRSAFMVGGNPYAARLSGMKPHRVKAILLVNSSVMSVLAGVVWSCQKKMASPTNLVTNAPNFQALTAAILGGISFVGGSGGMAGAFAAMLLLNVFSSALIITGLPSYVNYILQGLILIFALILDNFNTMRQRRALQAAAIAGAAAAKKAKA